MASSQGLSPPQLPVCTEADNLRRCLWQSFQTFVNITPELIDAIKQSACLEAPPTRLIDAFKANGWILSCLIESLEEYRINDCSEMGIIRQCVWDFNKYFNWNKPIPPTLIKFLNSVGERDKFVPSDGLLDKFEQVVGDGMVDKCLIKLFRKIRYCQAACESSTTCPECPALTCPSITCPVVSCPSTACPAPPTCPEVSCPEQYCPKITCPEQSCPKITCPECPSAVDSAHRYPEA